VQCDRLLEMGFRDAIVKLLKCLPPTASRQTLLFSATLPSDLKTVTDLALKKEHTYVNCVGEDAPETATNARQRAVIVPKEEWLPRLSQVRARVPFCML
jgi:ATP-dependent RNA helicase MSS116, mitochondrial